MRGKILCVLALVCAASLPGQANDRSASREAVRDYAGLLGLDLVRAFERFGVPAEVSAVRGEEAWQDDVVFRYETGLSLFWYRGRVWQVRFEAGFGGSFTGFSMGARRHLVTAALGEPLHAADDWVLYQFAGDGYPLRLRLFFGEAGLEDAYLYRGDF